MRVRRVPVGVQLHRWPGAARHVPSGRPGPSAVNVMGCHVRPPRLARIYPGRVSRQAESIGGTILAQRSAFARADAAGHGERCR